MEDPRVESSESGEESEGRIDRQLDEATFKPDETVERKGDFEMSEAIEAGFAELMDASDLLAGESLDIDPQDIDEQDIDTETIERVAKIDSFTWKLQVAKDEVGHFRVPSLHGDKPMMDVPDPGTPNPTGESIEPIMETGASEQSEEGKGGFPSDVTELANLVLGMAVEDVEQDLEDYQAKQEAMDEAKQAIRDQLGSQPSVNMDASPEPAITPLVGLEDNTSSEEVEKVEESTATEARYVESESEPQDRADAASAEESDKSETPPEPDRASADDEERD